MKGDDNMCEYCKNTTFFYTSQFLNTITSTTPIVLTQILNAKICPVCGKILADDASYKKEILKDIIVKNAIQMSYEEYNSLVIQSINSKMSNFLQLNNFIVKDNFLYCSCGEKLGPIYKPIKHKNDVLLIIGSKLYCNGCKRKLQPFKEL